MDETERIVDGYRRESAALIQRYRAISPEALFAPVRSFFPSPPARALDLGAGLGRDALWLAGLGYDVVAVEPVDAFREAGRAATGALAARWIDDRLPELNRLSKLAPGPYDLAVMNAVWQHVAPADRPGALRRIAARLAPSGVLILSLRHGPGAAGRLVWPIDVDETRRQAQTTGLTVRHAEPRASLQGANVAAGVTWMWLVLTRDDSGAGA